MLENINEVENLAFSLELNENFKNFNSFDFLERYNKKEISDKEFDTFLKMCFYDSKIQIEKEKIRKKAEKGKR